MDCLRLQFHTSISEIVEPWTSLEKACADPSIQNNFLVLNAWYACHCEGRAPAFVSLWDKSLCLGIYPFTLERKYGARIFNTPYRDAFSISKPIVRDGFHDLFFNELVKRLRVRKSEWDVMKFSGVYRFDREHALLESAFTAAGADVYTVRDHTYSVTLSSSFEDYSAAYLSKKTVTDLRRLEKKLAEHDHRFLFYRNFEALAHMRRFYDMENTGWKKDSGTPLINDQNYLVYTDSFVHNCSLANKFVMTFLEIDGQKIAGQFGYIENGVYNLLRTAYEREFSKYAPSVLLFLDTLRLMLRSFPEIKTINYYPGSYGYKQKYSKDDCECNTYVLFSDSLKGKFFSRAYRRKMARGS